MAVQSFRWRLPGERDVAAHLSRINRLRHLAIHAIEAFSRRRGIAIDSVVHQRACNELGQDRRSRCVCDNSVSAYV
jgi:hypothetical protein